MKKTPTEQLPDQEAVLLDYVERLKKFKAGRRAVHIHLSRLRPYNRRDHHLRIATSTFDMLIQSFEGASFRLFSGDLFVICKGASVAQIDEYVLRLRFLFSDDPLLAGQEEEGEEFCTWFDADQDYLGLLTHANDLVAARARIEAELAEAAASPEVSQQAPTTPMDPKNLDAIARAIAQADISSWMRRQSICAVVPGHKPRPVFYEIYVSVDALRQSLLPDHDVMANRWLFQELTRHLDKRILAMVQRNDDATIDRSFSMNLNIETVLSPEFADFDNAINDSTRKTLIVELHMIDVFADIASFIFARDFLHGRGYRICLDGTTHVSLPFVDRKKLGFDLVKLQWNKDLEDRMHGARGEILRDAIQTQSPDRIIMNRSDSEKAIEIGQSLGIALFQGHLLDRLLDDGTTESDTIESLTAAKTRHRAAGRQDAAQKKVRFTS